jgi:hypothetical protein
LAYWAYRRLKAIDDGLIVPDADAAAEIPQDAGGNAVVLRISTRR